MRSRADLGDVRALVEAAGQPVQRLVGALVRKVRAPPVEESRQGESQSLVGRSAARSGSGSSRARSRSRAEAVSSQGTAIAQYTL